MSAPTNHGAKAKEYRDRAADYFRLAQAAITPEARTSYENIARSLLHMAGDMDFVDDCARSEPLNSQAEGRPLVERLRTAAPRERDLLPFQLMRPAQKSGQGFVTEYQGIAFALSGNPHDALGDHFTVNRLAKHRAQGFVSVSDCGPSPIKSQFKHEYCLRIKISATLGVSHDVASAHPAGKIVPYDF
jgi:hypothetical protein